MCSGKFFAAAAFFAAHQVARGDGALQPRPPHPQAESLRQ
jgi:hypothetical protein